MDFFVNCKLHDAGANIFNERNGDWGRAIEESLCNASNANSPFLPYSHEVTSYNLDCISPKNITVKHDDEDILLSPTTPTRISPRKSGDKRRDQLNDEQKRERRRVKNRESARRSRAKKKQTMQEKEVEIEELKVQNDRLAELLDFEARRAKELELQIRKLEVWFRSQFEGSINANEHPTGFNYQ
eukprot:g1138.t1